MSRGTAVCSIESKIPLAHTDETCGMRHQDGERAPCRDYPLPLPELDSFVTDPLSMPSSQPPSMPSTPATACDHAAAGDVAALRALPTASLHQLDAKGSAPVHWAASCGHVDCLAFLIGEGCDAECEGIDRLLRQKSEQRAHRAP